MEGRTTSRRERRNATRQRGIFSTTAGTLVGLLQRGAFSLGLLLSAACARTPDAVRAEHAVVTISDASAPVTEVAVEDGGSGPYGERAERCIIDPICPASEADRLFRAADDARESVNCFRFLDGQGTPRDVARGRACLERALKGGGCEGSSAFLPTAELAVLRIDGLGGARDVAGARHLFDGCVDDITKSAVLAHADAVEKLANTPAMNFCRDHGGTTLTSNDCQARQKSAEETRAQLQAKAIAASLDDEGKARFAAAAKAYAVYVGKMGMYVYRVHIGGSMRNMLALARERELLIRRTTVLARFAQFAPATIAKGAIDRSTREVAALERKTRPAAGELKGAFVDAQRAWTAYRDAELALFDHVYGAAHGRDRVGDTTLARLNEERLVDLRHD